jgi:hypothetical protein
MALNFAPRDAQERAPELTGLSVPTWGYGCLLFRAAVAGEERDAARARLESEELDGRGFGKGRAMRTGDAEHEGKE